MDIFNYINSKGIEVYKGIGTNLIPTGSTERNKANNIYDLAGNVWEWTQESAGYNNAGYRGGLHNSKGSDYPAAARYYGSINGTWATLGCRATLYIAVDE